MSKHIKLKNVRKANSFCEFIRAKFPEVKFKELYIHAYNLITYNSEDSFKQYLMKETGKTEAEITNIFTIKALS